MMKARTLASLILLTLATDAGAQLYKYAGPDGKLVYSDRPPVNPTPRVQRFSAGVPRALGADEPGYFAARKVDPAEASPRQPAAASAAGASAAGPSAPEVRAQQFAALLPALRIAMNATTLIDRSVDLCIRTLPKAFRRYVDAQDVWKGRNAAVTDSMSAALSDLATGEERLRLDQGAVEYTSAHLQPVRALSMTKRIEWCEQMAGNLGSGKADLAAIADMRPLVQGRPR